MPFYHLNNMEQCMMESKHSEVKTIYYKDELNDEFAGDSIQAIPIDGGYRYVRDNIPGKISHFFWYRIIATPLAYLYLKIHFHHRFVGKDIIKKYSQNGYFFYGNHTHFMADALIPTMVNIPKDTYVIVHPNNVSMPILGKITPSLGAIPLPDDIDAGKNFIKTVDYWINKRKCIMIYPEAHIWPFYTDIRPFKNDSFRYPVIYKTPVFCLTNTYQKRKHGSKPRMITYVDGPFFSDETLKSKAAREKLRDEVYLAMKERAKNNNICMVRYEKYD